MQAGPPFPLRNHPVSLRTIQVSQFLEFFLRRNVQTLKDGRAKFWACEKEGHDFKEARTPWDGEFLE